MLSCYNYNFHCYDYDIHCSIMALFNVAMKSSLVYSNRVLPLSRWWSLLYGNQSIDLLSKSVDLFLYNQALPLERVKTLISQENTRTEIISSNIAVCWECKYSVRNFGGINFTVLNVDSNDAIGFIRPKHINSFQPSVAHLYRLKTSENLKVFWCFQGV